ncbi:MAG: hypothetical protein R3C10_03335 [Pirellulales bacterium]
MDDAEALVFAEEVFKEAATAKAVVVASEIPRDKSSPLTASRRLDRLIQRTRELVLQGQISEARSLVQSVDWTGPPMLWWCDDPKALQPVLKEVYGILQARKQPDGYDISFVCDGVALLLIWHDR